jgi:hypothetical protein
VLHKELFAPGSTGEQLWDLGLVSRLLAADSLAARTAGLLAVIETPGAIKFFNLTNRIIVFNKFEHLPVGERSQSPDELGLSIPSVNPNPHFPIYTLPILTALRGS